MPSPSPRPPAPAQTCQVFAAADVFVAQGVNLDDALGLPDEVCLGDVYTLDPAAVPRRLALTREGGAPRIAPGTEVGAPGDPVRLLVRYRLMDPEAGSVDLLLIEVADGIRVALPLSPMGARRDYTLVSVEPVPQDVALADLLCVSFARGTRITLADGRVVGDVRAPR